MYIYVCVYIYKYELTTIVSVYKASDSFCPEDPGYHMDVVSLSIGPGLDGRQLAWMSVVFL